MTTNHVYSHLNLCSQTEAQIPMTLSVSKHATFVCADPNPSQIKLFHHHFFRMQKVVRQLSYIQLLNYTHY